MGTRRTGDPERQVEERLAVLLRPGPRRALLPPEPPELPGSRTAADADDTLIGDRPTPDPDTADIAVEPAAEQVDSDEREEDTYEDGVDPDIDHVPLPQRRGRSLLSGLLQLLPVGSFAGFGRPQLAVIALIVAIGVLFGGWAVLRARPVAIGAPRLTATTGAPTAAETGATTPASSVHPSSTASGSTPPTPPLSRGSTSPKVSSSAAALRVHVLGAVHNPGVVTLSPGARVQDAIKQAGGTKKSARLGDLNLAQPLADGQQVFVGHGKRDSEVRNPTSGPAPDAAATGAAGQTSTDSGAAPPSGPVDLNTATLDQLDGLPGVGPVTAQKILDWRSEHGKFSTVDELQEVDGIGPKTFADLKPEVTV